MSKRFAPIRPYWLEGEEDKQATAHQSGTAVPSRPVATQARRFAPPTPWWEEPSPVPSGTRVPSRNAGASGFLASVEYGRCGKAVGVAVMECAPRREIRAASHGGRPRMAPPVPYWREPGASSLATNARGWAAVWNTVWNAIRPGEPAFAANA